MKKYFYLFLLMLAMFFVANSCKAQAISTLPTYSTTPITDNDYFYFVSASPLGSYKITLGQLKDYYSSSGAFTQMNIIGNAGSASAVAITDNTTTNSLYYPLISSATSGNVSPNTSSTRWTFNPSTGFMGLNTTTVTPGGAMDISYNGHNTGTGTPTLLIGADVNTTNLTTRTNGVNKLGTIAFPSYNNSSVGPWSFVYGNATSTNNILYIGYGSSTLRGSTQIRIGAVPTQTTVGSSGNPLLVLVDGVGAYAGNVADVSFSAPFEVKGFNTTSTTVTYKWKNSAGTALGQFMNNGFCGFGTTSPSAILHAIGTGTTSATFSLKALNSGGTKGIYVNDAGQLYGTSLHNNASAITGTTNQYVASGTYTPIITGVLNYGSSSNSTAIYHRVGNVMTVSGFVDVVPFSAAHVIVRISLPVPSTFTTGFEVNGSATEQTFPFTVAVINANVTNNDVFLHINAASTSSHIMSYIYQYEVK